MNDLSTIQDIARAALFLVPLISGITEVLKRSLKLKKRFTKLTALLLGIAIGLLVIDFSVVAGVAGAMLGLSATGLYENIKK